jgi:excinuclease UvrABC helicase subunit UvrB
MMCARARALLAFQKERPKAALAAIREGIEGIKDFFKRFGPEHSISESSELAILRAMAKEIEGRIPEDPIAKLRKDLAKAVKEERYEDAAGLRDQLRTIRQSGPGDDKGRA